MSSLTKEERDCISNLAVLTDLKREQLKDFFENYCATLILSYVHNKEAVLPYVGKFKIEEDEQGVLSLRLTISEGMKMLLTQLENQEKTYIEELFEEKILEKLTQFIQS